jgi:hypothetical protein
MPPVAMEEHAGTNDIYPSFVLPVSFFSFIACFYELINCSSFLFRIYNYFLDAK